MSISEPLGTIRRNSIDETCTRLGVRCKDWHLFQRWAGKPLTAKALDEVHAYVDVMIAIRCHTPGADLLSELIATGVGGEDLTVDELRAVVVAMVSRAG
jgi:hypothetical protein